MNERQLKQLKKARRIAKKRGGECLSDEYIKSKNKMLWRCKKGHVWSASYDNTYRGHWCPICNRGYPATLQRAIEAAQEHGGYCLSSESDVKNNKSVLEWKCNNLNHPSWESSYDAVVNNKNWCFICSIGWPASIEKARQKAREHDGYCLSLEHELENKTSYLEWKCKNLNHPSWRATYGSVVKRNGSWCSLCNVGEPANFKKLLCKISKHNGRCLSKESDLKNSKSKLRFKCSNASHDSWVASYGKIVNQGTWCPQCTCKKTEIRLKTILEQLLCAKAKLVRPSWLKNPDTNCNLEIDIFFEDLKIAVEYNGRQHYFPGGFGMNDEEFKRILKRDALKKQLIKNNPDKVEHFIIFSYKDKITEELVKSRLIKNNILIQ